MLNLCEIFKSVQGESTHAGRPCIFVRLTGCNLRCAYCDTAYAYQGDKQASVAEVIDLVDGLGSGIVEITGGEPLLQLPEVLELASQLRTQGRTVLVETNGSIPLPPRPRPFHAILDVKCPGSGESERVCWENLNRLQPGDEVKFVVAGQEDFDWAVGVIRNYHLDRKATVLFSPVFGQCPLADLAAWVANSGLDVRMQLQLHKVVWHPDTRGV